MIQNKTAMMVTYQNSGKKAIKIMFPFKRETVEQVKTIPGRKFHSQQWPKYWTAPLSIEAVEKLKDEGFELDPHLEEFLQKSQANVKEMQEEVRVPGLKGDLFPFQKKGVAFLDHRDGRALIADEMGLGKTIQALAWLQKHPKKRPAVIVCPASLKLNWEKEIHAWMSNPRIQILQGTKADKFLISDIIIINYDIFKDWAETIKDLQPQVMILDEAHLIKNNQAKRTKAVKKVAKTVPHVITLTGTPIVNRPVEALNAIRLVDETVVPDQWYFLQRYCGAKHNGFGWDFNGATNTEELHQKLVNTIMIRRRKEDVLKDLPAKIRSFVPIELQNRKEYQKAESDFIDYVKKQKGEKAAERASNAQALTEIEGLKTVAVEGKIEQCVEWIQNYLDNNGKLVIMGVHRFVIDRIIQAFPDISVKVDGSVSGENRNKAIESFQNNPNTKLFVGNIKAAGTGLTLTAASTMVFLELPWTPGDMTQAEDRIHRIGQENHVAIYYLLAQNTIEEDIAKLIDRKQKVLDSTLDGKETDENSLLSELMNEYK